MLGFFIFYFLFIYGPYIDSYFLSLCSYTPMNTGLTSNIEEVIFYAIYFMILE